VIPHFDRRQVRVLLLDIEGTTTPVDFFSRTLLPFARRRLEEFLSLRGGELGVREDLNGLRKQHAADMGANLEPPAWSAGSPDADLASALAYIYWSMDRDSKYAALKSLQGKIWRDGFKMGELRGEVYPDVPSALSRWSQNGTLICIYSTVSVIAQRLLFSTATAGNLTGFIHSNFDLAAGAKNDPQSYLRIAGSLTLPPRQILFISAVAEELDAALHAGMRTALCIRTQASEGSEGNHSVIRSFHDIFPAHRL
jgi:enolase-phosphatase E1